MKTKVLILVGVCIQCMFLIFWLFCAPEIAGELKIAHSELQNGNADLPTLEIRDNTMDTTVIYDPLKSNSENLVVREKVRLALAYNDYKSFVRIPFILAMFNMALLIVLLWFRRLESTADPS